MEVRVLDIDAVAELLEQHPGAPRLALNASLAAYQLETGNLLVVGADINGGVLFGQWPRPGQSHAAA